MQNHFIPFVNKVRLNSSIFFFSFLRIDKTKLKHFDFRTKKIEENFLMFEKVQSGKRVGASWHILFKNIDF